MNHAAHLTRFIFVAAWPETEFPRLTIVKPPQPPDEHLTLAFLFAIFFLNEPRHAKVMLLEHALHPLIHCMPRDSPPESSSVSTAAVEHALVSVEHPRASAHVHLDELSSQAYEVELV